MLNTNNILKNKKLGKILRTLKLRSPVFWGRYQAREKHSITRSSSAVERANSEAAREFTKFKLSLSESMFRILLCKRLKKVLKVP